MGERLHIQERRKELLDRLRETLRLMVRLEGQLKSASTMSVSSSSSLGSLSTSSKGSSSLSFTDIYRSELWESDLQRRVERLLRADTKQSLLSLSPRSSLSSLEAPLQAPLEEEPLALHRSMSASDESVAGDSGVYEACTKGSSSPDAIETPQVQIKLRYPFHFLLISRENY